MRDKLAKVLLLFSLLLIIMITSLLLSISSTDQQITTTLAQTSDKMIIYDNPTFGIRIQYPSDWGRLDLSFLQHSADIDFYPLNDTSLAKNVKIQVNNLPSRNMTLEEYTNSQINLLEENLLESSAATLAGILGYKIVFTNIEGLKTMQVWTIKDDKAYIITYVTQEEDYEKELQIAQKMIDSFEIK
ncbi:MAG TPA: PsbP-related protein [Nitrososphaeraceae archaeon]|nr:PsbP-related protein [Nitrososphaeraceae archaeon]